MRKLGVAPKVNEFHTDAPPVNDWLDTVKQLLQAYQQGPAFSAYATGAQALGAATWTKLLCPTTELNTTNAYDVTTSRFTPKLPGWYQFSAAWLSSTTSATSYGAALYKNGVRSKLGSLNYISIAANVAESVNGFIYCNGTTDYIEFYAFAGAATNTLIQDNGCVFFQGHLARPV